MYFAESAKPPTSVGGSLILAYVLTMIVFGPLLSRGATRGASGAAGEELNIGREGTP
jgi:hypothetical protein